MIPPALKCALRRKQYVGETFRAARDRFEEPLRGTSQDAPVTNRGVNTWPLFFIFY